MSAEDIKVIIAKKDRCSAGVSVPSYALFLSKVEYPKHIFTVVIWKSSRHKFKTAPEKMYKSKRICVTGVISSYRGKAQIEVNDPAQIH